jgi:hypothetical protein
MKAWKSWFLATSILQDFPDCQVVESDELVSKDDGLVCDGFGLG